MKMSHSAGMVVLSNKFFSVFVLLVVEMKLQRGTLRQGMCSIPVHNFYSHLALHHDTGYVNIFFPFSFLDHWVRPKCLNLYT